jgi:PAS domain S-box-containing protein
MENRTIKVLLIEDSVDDAELIKRKLEKLVRSKFQVSVAQKLNDGLEQAEKDAPDLILSDLGLPDSHGIDTVTKILLAVPHIPLVVLSGFDDEDIAIKAVQSGAQDYLVKGQIENFQLERSIYYSIERARLHDELEQNAHEISKLHANLLRILENNADAIVVVGEENRVLFTNSAIESLFGRKPKELLHLPFQYPLNAGKTFEVEIHRADEKITIAEMSVVNISWEGKPAYLVSMHDITKRKQMEEALRTSEEKYRVIVEMAQYSIITVNLQGQITACNEAFANMRGASVEEIIGKHFTEIPFMYNEEIPSYAEMFTSLINGKKFQPMEIVWNHQDGTNKISELRANLMKNNGKIIGVQAMIIDISERKQMENALRESEEKFSKAFMHSPQAIVITNLDQGIILEANDTFLELTGYSREELIGKKAIELDLWNSPQERTEVIKTLKERGIVKNLERQFSKKSGEIHTWLFSAENITIDNKPCMLSVTVDITERKKMEYALREREKRFSDIAENTLEWIWEVDVNGKYTYSSPVVEKILGYKPEEILEKYFYSFFLPEEQEELKKAALEVFAQKQPFSEFINRNTHKNGKTVDLLTSGVPIIDKEGNYLGYRGVDTDITERKKTEELLRFSDIAIKSIHEGILTFDNNSIITRWNKTCEQIIGIKASEAIGKPIDEIIHMVEEYPGQNDERLKLLQEKGVNREEQIYRTPRGNIWVDVQAQAMEDNGKRTGWVTLITDITARKKTEEALKQSEEKYRELINTSTDSIISSDSQMNITIFNHGAERIFGYTEKEILGQSIMTIFPKSLHRYIAREIINIKNTGTAKYVNRIFETYGLKKDCTTIPIEVSLSTRKTENNYIITSIIRDISIRKEAEEKLRESEERYRDLFENATDLIQSCNAKGKLVYVNRAWRNALGYSEIEVPNLKFSDIIHPDYLEHCSQTLKKVMSGETVNNIETGFISKDKKLILVEGNVNPVSQEGKVVATRAIFRDITMRKEAEEKLRKVDQMKSEFLSNVSHELRTPLQSISGFTKLILTNKVPDPAIQQEFLQIVDRETVHLGNLINSLLDMSRLESGRFQIYKKIASLSDIFTDSRKMFHSLAREKDITFNEIIPAKLPKIEVDIERMRQVIINLLSNAIKFSDPGSVVNVKVAVRDGELLFQVADHGIGIRDETMVHLFERFYRVEGETVRGGTGLGLYISKQIIDAHGGRIWAESKFGQGSTFSFTLPLNNSKGGKKNDQEDSGSRRRSGDAKTGRLLAKARGIPGNHGF